MEAVPPSRSLRPLRLAAGGENPGRGGSPTGGVPGTVVARLLAIPAGGCIFFFFCFVYRACQSEAHGKVDILCRASHSRRMAKSIGRRPPIARGRALRLPSTKPSTTTLESRHTALHAGEPTQTGEAQVFALGRRKEDTQPAVATSRHRHHTAGEPRCT
jgi:hypothetical protein